MKELWAEDPGRLADYRYGYDDVGNRTYMQRYHRTGQPADVYQYDGLYQLVQVWYGADATDPGSITDYVHLQGYDLDELGNRLEVSNDGAGSSRYRCKRPTSAAGGSGI